ncbi:hypothetical protein CJ030_MR2G024018 [Morella rubra]|uniref:Uncharacterized protein n=1 Tax=Morella rubra TaxID=262757 RepID=A0A6A1W9X2_9ROSI|nr:hypothetical protein CJ030_MR2G024018 [Morella rubra]
MEWKDDDDGIELSTSRVPAKISFADPGGFLLVLDLGLDVVDGVRALHLQGFGDDQPLLIREDSFLVLDLGLDVVDGVRDR